jgi:hypothetical protein
MSESKKSILTTAMEMVENAKPGNMDDEKRETVRRRIKITAAFVVGVLSTVTVVATKAYYDSFNGMVKETTEDENDEN